MSSELVDLYGRRGFDVLCITDHSVRAFMGQSATDDVDHDGHADYIAAVAVEAERALDLYDLLVLPGLELTYDDGPARAAHAVAVGLDRFVGLDDGLEAALVAARLAGAAFIAAHPYALDESRHSMRGTGRWHADPSLGELVGPYELVNRHDVFSLVAERRLPGVASGHFHRREHLATWKTFLPYAKEPGAVVEFLRSPRPASLVGQAEASETRPQLRAA
jgi:hypothetical protein